MYHLELRQFPRSLTRFNLSGTQVGAILVPWSQKERVEVNGQSWDPADATITVIEGPEIPVHRLSMGRGWPLAQRQGEDVTARVLDEARQAVQDGSAYRQAAPTGGGGAAPVAGQAAGSLPSQAAPAQDFPSLDGGETLAAGVELAGLLGADAARLLSTWRAVSARTSGLSPSESLALAERELGSG